MSILNYKNRISTGQVIISIVAYTIDFLEKDPIDTTDQETNTHSTFANWEVVVKS